VGGGGGEGARLISRHGFDEEITATLHPITQCTCYGTSFENRNENIPRNDAKYAT
jgi:hypothetical protein